MPRQNPLGLSIYTFLKNEGHNGKTYLFQEWVSVGGGRP
jgi:hypothetical protein